MNHRDRDYPDSWRRPPMRGDRAYYEPYRQPYWDPLIRVGRGAREADRREEPKRAA